MSATTPAWFPPPLYGDVRISLPSGRKKILTLNARGFRVQIERGRLGYTIRWTSSPSPQLKIVGRLQNLHVPDVEAMFGLGRGKIDEKDQPLASRLSAEAFKRGFYIRQGPHLCLPGPGHSYAGDISVVSLFITDTIKMSVRRLLSTS